MNSPIAALEPRDRLIVALDFPTANEALDLAKKLAGEVRWFKIGLQLYTAAGPEIVRQIAATGAKIFLDLKLLDIPNTVAGAVRAASELPVRMLTIHLSGGSRMLEAAAGARGENLALLGVTVLTSSDAMTLRETGVAGDVEPQVERLAQLGIDAGLDGLVASPHEAKMLRKQVGATLQLIVPGVRPAWAEAGDQKRFTTPREAIENGADFLVIGRPITAHRDPRQAVRDIIAEISA